jgi:mono/diheme cytochrome c family protein
VRRVLDRAAAPDRPPWLRIALLRGVELGLGDGVPRGGPWRRVTRRSLSLPEPPTALAGLGDGSGEVADQARRVLARLDWPGKPPPVVEVPPLAPDEKARFEAGRALYENLCVACHQTDGRGGELAPALAGSPRVVGPAGIPTRIVLGGMEGDSGLMPPLGTLSDTEIAAVLTYVRREWGHTASPVRPEDVREIRGLTALRKRPWTSEDLSAVRRP